MSDKQDYLKDVIQEKKGLRDYYTVEHGLETERQCFEAIEALGNRKYILKAEIQKKLAVGADPEKDTQLKALVLAAQEIHMMQSRIVDDVCERFEVIHPEYVNPSQELLKLKQPYWDWYKDQYKKYYGTSAPDVV